MTGINIWDHVKSAADISKFAKSCSAGKGNVVSMANLGKNQIRGGVQMTPSTCKPHWSHNTGQIQGYFTQLGYMDAENLEMGVVDQD